MNKYLSWGRYFKYQAKEILPIIWRDEFSFEIVSHDCLVYGMGRSYGDSCLNDSGTLIPARGMNRLISWDEEKGILRCEAGVTLEEILNFSVPKGYFLPVTPGTKFVTVGGCIANDVHGKNHHKVGSFGNFIRGFGLLRSNGEYLTCTPQENKEYFNATIGGLGLTGIVTWVDLELKFAAPVIRLERIPFRGLEEFFKLSQEDDSEYSVAWMDCIDAWNPWGRGIYMKGEHSPETIPERKASPLDKAFVPFNFPSFLLNRYSCKAFNEVYYRLNESSERLVLQHYDPFFYPLDKLKGWNRIYGGKGFFQYQLLLPLGQEEAFAKIFKEIAKSGLGSFLVVLKKFGATPSPGMISFPSEGYTLTLDFSYRKEKTLPLLRRLTDIVNEGGGRLYPAKDSIMTPEDFKSYYARLPEFLQYKDPRFSSSFWRRVYPG